jgi:hypothetical protein
MNWPLSRFRAGSWVEVRTKDEILATLDPLGSYDGMPFMPEMLQYCGQRFRVSLVAHKTCDTVRKTFKLRRLRCTVHLEGLRCNGSAHGGCQAECNLFWKDVWLKPVEANGDRARAPVGNDRKSSVGECSEGQLVALTRLPRTDEGEGMRYSCQATRLYEATESLAWWDLRQYVYDVVTGNHDGLRVLQTLWLASLRWFLQRLPFGYRAMMVFTDWMHYRATGRPIPSVRGCVSRGLPTPTGQLDVQPGEYVRIKSQQEIEQTLDKTCKNLGLFFDWEMLPYCNRVFKVGRRVSRIIDEPTGKMLHMKHPCITLEGVVCRSQYNPSRLMCPRAITPYWREVWLERVNGDAKKSKPDSSNQ